MEPSEVAPSRKMRVSVALCTYNSVAFLEDQLTSILEQTLPVDEVVIADDGSTDGTLGLIDAIRARHERGHVVRVVATDRAGGVGANLERALRACTGEIIALSDHDDVWHVDRMARCIEYFGGEAPVLTFSDANLIDGSGVETGRTLFGAYRVTRAELDGVHAGRAFDVIQRRNIATGATIAFDRAVADSALPFPERWIHDEWLAIIAGAIGRVEVIEDQLIGYRVHGANQIGVPSRSPMKRLRAALGVGRARFVHLRERDAILAARLAALGADEALIAQTQAKLVFEDRRVRYSRLPPLRVPAILREWARGSYHRHTPRWAAEMLVDAFQRP